MKPFDALTHDELIALTEADIAFYIDRACAEEGIALVPPTVPESPTIPQSPKTVEHFVIAGIRFAVEAEARAVQSAIQAASSRRSMQYAGSRYNWNDPQFDVPAEDDASAVTRELVFDATNAHQQKADNDRLSDRKKAYEAAKKEYDSATTDRESVSNSIRSAVEAANRQQRRIDRLMSEYERYLPLANGDELIAKRFLQRAHGDAREVLPALFPDGWNDEPARQAETASSEVEF